MYTKNIAHLSENIMTSFCQIRYINKYSKIYPLLILFLFSQKYTEHTEEKQGIYERTYCSVLSYLHKYMKILHKCRMYGYASSKKLYYCLRYVLPVYVYHCAIDLIYYLNGNTFLSRRYIVYHPHLPHESLKVY